MKRAYEISTQMDESPYYVKLKLMHNDDSPLLLYSKLFMSHKYFLEQMATFDDIDEVFLYLPNSSAILGKKRVFVNAKVAMIFADTEDNLKDLKRLFITANQKLCKYGRNSICYYLCLPCFLVAA